METDIDTVVSAPAPLAHTRAATQQPGEFLTFRLGAEEYAFEILRVQEIRSFEAPTRIANAPDFIKGVINLRGVIVPIVDLRLKLDCPTADFDAFTVVVVLNIRNKVVGAVVDSVSDVVNLDAGDIKPAPELADGPRSRFITGIGCIEADGRARTLVLLDVEPLLARAMALVGP